jgi:hypothetical protein
MVRTLLFSATQDYRSLKRRLWAQFGVTLTEAVSSLVKPQGKQVTSSRS